MHDVQDLRTTIVPKSDQLNAEQLLGGPLTVTVTEVRTSASDEQPVVIHYAGDNGRPFKPCKTMRKLLVFAWGEDGRAWPGRSMTLYNDPDVRFGGAEVGGIRISHLTDIAGDIKVSLTSTKGKKAMHNVKLMAAPKVAAPTLAEVLAAMPKVKGQKGKTTMEQMIERLPFEDQMTATEALTAHIATLQAAHG